MWVCVVHAALGGAGVGAAQAAGYGGFAAAEPEGDARDEAIHRWRNVAGLGPVEGVVDVAADPGGALALADAYGVLLAWPSGTEQSAFETRRVTTLGLATRVRFDEAGALWAAGERGLLRIDAAGGVLDASPGVGQAERALAALDVRAGLVAVGSVDGAWVGEVRPGPDERPSVRWVRVREGLAQGAVGDVAIGGPSRSGHRPLWLVVGGELQLAWIDLREDGLSISNASTQRVVGAPMGDPVRRVVARSDMPAVGAEASVSGPGGGRSAPGTGAGGRPDAGWRDGAAQDVAVLYGRAVARLVGASLEPGGERSARWEVVYPVLPPEAQITDVEVVQGRVWLATTGGLLQGARLAGPHRRASSPAGSRALTAVACAGDVVFAASTSQLLAGEVLRWPSAVRVSETRMPRDPELARVHTRALTLLRLEPQRSDALWRGLARRGWWPTLSLQGGADYNSGRTRDYDENFSYGQINRLNDRNIERSTDYDAGILLSWDLGELAYSNDAVDLSREIRQVIGLRDNVLDEINQLYFDRQRALRALAGFADWSDPEAAALRLRALELAAGLDAWTGGWFSTQVEIPPAARAEWLRPLRPVDETIARPSPAPLRPEAHPDPHPEALPETAVPSVDHDARKRENS